MCYVMRILAGRPVNMPLRMTCIWARALKRSMPPRFRPMRAWTVTSYDPGRLELGKTYYWRVDEVNAAPDNTVYKGNVWSFTVEPFAYPIEGVIAATTNGISAQGRSALIESTVNGSGLNEDDQHSVDSDPTCGWAALPVPIAALDLQYEFDGVYKLHRDVGLELQRPVRVGSRFRDQGRDCRVLHRWRRMDGSG